MVRLVGSQTMMVSSTPGKEKPDEPSPEKKAIHGVVLKSATPKKSTSKPISSKSNSRNGPLSFVGAKPSDIKYASKRAQERKDAVRKREEAAQLKMQKFRDEIDAIKRKELGENETKITKRASTQRLDEMGAETKELEIEQVLGMLEDDDEDSLPEESFSTKARGNRVISEMNTSFATLNLMDDDLDLSSSVHASTTRYVEPQRRSELQATKTGKLEKERPSLQRQASNLVPEMRRRATQRDLMYDDHGAMQSPVTSPRATTKKSVQMNGQDVSKVSISEDEPKITDTTNTAASARFSKKSSKAPTAEDLAKLEEEKKKMEEHREKIEEAREAFQVGHDFCWQDEEPALALGEYRKALFIRESLLGKYHEETGRSYFWIGKSLFKLRAFNEALVAYSRAMRIFDRVLMQSNKYNKWSKIAIESVFNELDADDDRDYETYKNNIAASIEHERAGDRCRKRGQTDQAIAEYRAAIGNIEEYHPDAADLYCKIAIIMRQQGEFDRALEEYRFASEIYELSLGAQHPDTVKTLNQLYEKKRLNQVSMALMEKLKLRN